MRTPMRERGRRRRHPRIHHYSRLRGSARTQQADRVPLIQHPVQTRMLSRAKLFTLRIGLRLKREIDVSRL